MSDYTGEVKNSVVKIRIIKASKPTYWYADKVGKVVEAYKSVTQQDGKTYISYKQFPRAKGFEPSGDYDTHDVKENVNE